MAIAIEAIVYYLILLDSIGAVILSICCVKWYKKRFGWFSKHFPATKGWAIYYFILALWVGISLDRLGVLPYWI